jgi:glycosyltransferase involved in cell wall biosynthesis
MKSNFVLITPARNEKKHIEKTIRSVISQTVLPVKWVIVSDGSTDGTDEIVKGYAKEIDWIELVRMPEHRNRHFAAKVQSFNAGYERVKDIEYDIIGNIDADISFGEDFFEYLLDQFNKMPELGVGGTDYTEGTFHSFKNSYISAVHVNGQCQLFRRECFEDIGGYTPIKAGGIDWVAVTTARMKGWKTHSFSDRTYIHHAAMGRTYGNRLSARFNYGKKDYFCGGHPLWEIFRGFFQMTRKPYIVGGSLLLLGYFWAWATCMERPVSKELIEFHQKEQMQRLKNLFSNMLRLNR